MTDPKRTTPNPMPVSHVLEPGKELFADTLPREVDGPLFAPPANTPARAERRPTPRPRRWRDEDMPLRPGDVIAVGLRHHNCVVGQVAAVNDQCFRLNQHNRGGDTFNTGVAVVAWSQVEEFGPVARKRGAAWLMQELAAFQTAWTEGRK